MGRGAGHSETQHVARAGQYTRIGYKSTCKQAHRLHRISTALAVMARSSAAHCPRALMLSIFMFLSSVFLVVYSLSVRLN